MHLLTDIKSLDPLLKDIDERRIVMLGEASHGTHEYYTWRTAISKRGKKGQLCALYITGTV